MSFLYSQLLKLLYPTSVSILLLLAAAALWRWKREKLAKIAFWAALAVLMICGNGWIVGALTKHLERQYPPLSSQPSTLNSQAFQADAILVLSGGIAPKIPPRPTVEIGEAGDRLLYGAYLFRTGKAPCIICTGKVATGGLVRRPVADEMVEFLDLLGIPTNAIVTEIKSENTREHAKYLYPVLQQRGFKRVLLVTSALHMPRSVGVFRHLCPGIEFIPAPTDFRATDRLPIPVPWYRHLTVVIPNPRNLVAFSEAMHEYLGIAYYRIRGWM